MLMTIQSFTTRVSKNRTRIFQIPRKTTKQYIHFPMSPTIWCLNNRMESFTNEVNSGSGASHLQKFHATPAIRRYLEKLLTTFLSTYKQSTQSALTPISQLFMAD